MNDFFQGKAILITGAAGSVGKELLKQLLVYQPAEIRAVDNNETEIFLLGEAYKQSTNVRVFLGDLRDSLKMENLFGGVDIVFHAAAYKHVGLSEYNPFDAVQTNIIGVKNIIQSAMRHLVKYVIFTSSDKAVNPTNVMGTSKLMGERLITAANIVNINGKQVFSSVRFGNVMGSRGSVVPIFASQIRGGGPVTVTDGRMTRFFMTLEEAVRLVLEACTLACGGEVFVTKMRVMRILDLAQAMIELLAPAHGYHPDDIPIAMIGPRTGEKLYEELMTAEEIDRSFDLKNMFVILPALRGLYQKIDYCYGEHSSLRPALKPYISHNEKRMTVAEIKELLVNCQILKDLKPLPGQEQEYLSPAVLPMMPRGVCG